MKSCHILVIAIICFLYGSPILAQEISWLPGVNKNSIPAASNTNKLIAPLKGKMRPMVCEYNGSKLSQHFSFETTHLKIGEQEWKCAITQVPVASAKDAVDLNIVFKLMKGKMTSAGVAIAFDFNDWNTDNYVMIPASVYNGNRNKIEQRGYCTGFEKEDFYNKDIPQITTELPQLSPSSRGASKIEVSSCNASTPAICLLDKKRQQAFIVLSEQGIRKGEQILDNGFVSSQKKNYR